MTNIITHQFLPLGARDDAGVVGGTTPELRARPLPSSTATVHAESDGGVIACRAPKVTLYGGRAAPRHDDDVAVQAMGSGPSPSSPLATKARSPRRRRAAGLDPRRAPARVAGCQPRSSAMRRPAPEVTSTCSRRANTTSCARNGGDSIVHGRPSWPNKSWRRAQRYRSAFEPTSSRPILPSHCGSSRDAVPAPGTRHRPEHATLTETSRVDDLLPRFCRCRWPRAFPPPLPRHPRRRCRRGHHAEDIPRGRSAARQLQSQRPFGPSLHRIVVNRRSTRREHARLRGEVELPESIFRSGAQERGRRHARGTSQAVAGASRRDRHALCAGA